MGQLGQVLGGSAGGLKSLAGQVITISAFDVEEDENGKESVAIVGKNGDGAALQARTTSGVVIRQLFDLKAANLLPATVRIDEVRSGSGRNYLKLVEPDA